MRHDKRTAYDEWDQRQDHGNAIDPACSVELPFTSAEQRGTILGTEVKTPNSGNQDPEFADAERDDGVAQYVFVELGFGDGTCLSEVCGCIVLFAAVAGPTVALAVEPGVVYYAGDYDIEEENGREAEGDAEMFPWVCIFLHHLCFFSF